MFEQLKYFSFDQAEKPTVLMLREFTIEQLGQLGLRAVNYLEELTKKSAIKRWDNYANSTKGGLVKIRYFMKNPLPQNLLPQLFFSAFNLHQYAKQQHRWLQFGSDVMDIF